MVTHDTPLAVLHKCNREKYVCVNVCVLLECAFLSVGASEVVLDV